LAFDTLFDWRQQGMSLTEQHEPNTTRLINSLRFYASLRADLLELVTGVDNARLGFLWDDTQTNFSTKRDLHRIQFDYLNQARKFGIYIATRHIDCPNKNHDDGPGEYPVSSNTGLEIKYPGQIPGKTENYIWTGHQLYQGDGNRICPCSPKNKESIHWVIDDVIYDEKVSTSIDRDKLVEIFTDIAKAIENSGDKKPRSGIRELLLRAILRINVQILPIPMDEFISKYCS
jgi:hypothetical protein